MSSIFSQAKQAINQYVWADTLSSLHGLHRWAVTLLRLAYVLIKDFTRGNITLRAMGLVYTTLLSLVPLLALAFSMLKAFGMDNALRPMLEHLFLPLGEHGQPLIEIILNFVGNVRVGVLGILGLSILLYSVISLIQKIEAGCNAIWQVRNLRSLKRRFTEYLSVLVVGPLVAVSALGITASLSSSSIVSYIANIEPFGSLLYLTGRILPVVMISAVFSFLYAFLPNTHVRALPALGGGIFAGVLWQAASIAFTRFAAHSGNVNAIYSGFAIIILLLIWLYISWLIMLFGCRLAFLLQHQEQLRLDTQTQPITGYHSEKLALLIMTAVAQRFLQGKQPWDIERLARQYSLSAAHSYWIIERLIEQDLLTETGPHADQLLPKKDIAAISVNEVINAIRASRHFDQQPLAQQPQLESTVYAQLHKAEQARKATYGDISIRDLAEQANA